MALEHWSGMMAGGENAEYFYNQSDHACWAARKMGDRLEVRNPAKRDLTREQIEALFRDPS
jgi:hypothetical protein